MNKEFKLKGIVYVKDSHFLYKYIPDKRYKYGYKIYYIDLEYRDYNTVRYNRVDGCISLIGVKLLTKQQYEQELLKLL